MSSPKKFYLIAGERSGDQHAARLISALKAKHPDAEFRCYGGDSMQEAGATLVRHYRELAFMGVLEVIRNLRTILRLMKECQADIAAWQPDVIIGIDYSGFNLKIAKWAKKETSIPYVHYIAPKVWAWNSKRVYKIRKIVERMYCILPFEPAFFAKYDYPSEYVGNPVRDQVDRFERDLTFRDRYGLGEKKLIAVLPGSRAQEIEKNLKVMASLQARYPDHTLVVAAVPTYPREYFEEVVRRFKVRVVYNETYDLLLESEAAVVTSGTATLETALLGCPQVVCYKTSAFTYVVGSMVVFIKFFSLVNLILDKEAVTELLQSKFNPDQVQKELDLILPGGERREEVLSLYGELRDKIGPIGTAERVADRINAYLETRA